MHVRLHGSLATMVALVTLAPSARAQERQIDGSYVQARVEQALRVRMPWSPEAVRFEDWRLPSAFAVPAEARGLRVQLAPGEDFIGTVRVELEFFAPERPGVSLQRRAASVDLAVERAVWIATTPLRRGASLAEASVQRELRDVRDVPETALDSLDTVWGQRLKVNVKEGTALLASHFDSPDLVRRGDAVEVEAGGAGLEMRLTARALQPGKLGDLIRVENPSSHRSFAVRITGRGAAELAQPGVGEGR